MVEVAEIIVHEVLRMAGLDALDLDAEPEPPDGELGEVEERIGTGQGNAVIGADGSWQKIGGGLVAPSLFYGLTRYTLYRVTAAVSSSLCRFSRQ